MFRQAFALFTTGIAIFSCAAVCSANEPATKYCRVRFGNNAKEVLITRTSDSILIHRDGNLDSEPDRHAMKGSRLSGDAIKPFQNKSVTYQITSVEEHREDEQHVLLVHVNTTDVMAPLTQIAEIELSSDVEETQCANLMDYCGLPHLRRHPARSIPVDWKSAQKRNLWGQSRRRTRTAALHTSRVCLGRCSRCKARRSQ